MEANGLYPKIARIMGRLNRLPKTGTNKHFNYDFVTDADVADAVRRELAAENIAFFASMTEWQQQDKHTTATFEFTFVCGDSGEFKTCTWTGEAIDGQDKGLSKAATSAEKYFLLKTFMLSTGDTTDDPDSGSEDKDAQTPAQTRKTASKTRVSQSAPSSTPANGNAPQNGSSDMPAWITPDGLTRLRNKAAVHWGSEDEPMVYSHVYNRFADILGVEVTPKDFPAFRTMMEQHCKMDAEAIWEAVKAYVPKAEREKV